MLCVTSGFQALDVGQGVVGDPGVIGREDLGCDERSVLTAKRKVSILQERGWAANILRGKADKAREQAREREVQDKNVIKERTKVA